jgi:hypothetical protein
MKFLLIVFVSLFSISAFADGSLLDSVSGTGAYGWIDTVLERSAAWVIVSWLEFKIWSLTFSYNVASLVIESLGITQQIESRLNGLSSQVYAFVSFLRIIEALNIIFSAHAATMIMRLF